MSKRESLDPTSPTHPEFFHHTHDAICPLCMQKLKQAHPKLVEWFSWVKATRPIAHIAWSYRNATDQEAMFSAGKSREHYPNSMHNKTLPDGTPNAQALDLFVIDEDGNGRFPVKFYFMLNAENIIHKHPIEWSGAWKSFGESDHFQLSKEFLAEEIKKLT